MLPVFDVNGVPVGQMVWLKGEELRRECEWINLEYDASLSNPGLIARISMQLGRLVARIGKGALARQPVPRPSFPVASLRLAR